MDINLERMRRAVGKNERCSRYHYPKFAALFITALFVLMPFLAVASADGGMFAGKHGQFFYINENMQYAVIGFENGRQRMLLSVNFSSASYDRAVWIFPIPSDADKVNISLIDGAPAFEGSNVVEDARTSITDAAIGSALSYVFPPNFLSFMVMGLGGFGASGGYGVAVHSHIEKYGVMVEVISATEGIGIYNYLSGKNLTIPKGTVPQLDSYVKEGFSFVVSWLPGWSLAKNPGVVVDFPTDDIYYPLRLTSIYNDTVIPTEIFVMGYVSPKLYNDISRYTKVTYWKNYYGFDVDFGTTRDVFNFTYAISKNRNGKFTKIDINAPSSLFKDDLWIKDIAPGKVSYAEWVQSAIGRNSGFCFALPVIFLALSLLAGWITGLILFKPVEKRNRRYCLFLSLGNVLGIFGLVFWASIITIDQERLNKEWFLSGKIGPYFAITIALFIALLTALFALLYIPLF